MLECPRASSASCAPKGEREEPATRRWPRERQRSPKCTSFRQNTRVGSLGAASAPGQSGNEPRVVAGSSSFSVLLRRVCSCLITGFRPVRVRGIAVRRP